MLKKAISSDDLVEKAFLCVDPGTTQSGVVYITVSGRSVNIAFSDKMDNDVLIKYISGLASSSVDLILVEKTEIHKMAGQTTAKTIFVCGEIYRSALIGCKYENKVRFATRNKIKKSLLGRFQSTKDKHVRAKCCAEFGACNIDTVDFAGKKKRVSEDSWSSLAVFLAYVKSPEIFTEEF